MTPHRLAFRTKLTSVKSSRSMSQAPHTYGPTCHLARNVTFADSHDDAEPPPLKPQFFYSSRLSIDDALSTVPSTSGADAKAAKLPTRPFNASDNNALEEAWLSLSTRKDAKTHRKDKASKLLSEVDGATPELSPPVTPNEKTSKRSNLFFHKKAPRKPVDVPDPGASLPANDSRTDAGDSQPSSDATDKKGKNAKHSKQSKKARKEAAKDQTGSASDHPEKGKDAQNATADGDQNSETRTEDASRSRDEARDISEKALSGNDAGDRTSEDLDSDDHNAHKSLSSDSEDLVCCPGLVKEERSRVSHHKERSSDRSREESLEAAKGKGKKIPKSKSKTVEEKTKPHRHLHSKSTNEDGFTDKVGSNQRHEGQGPNNDSVLVEVSVVLDRKNRTVGKAKKQVQKTIGELVDDDAKSHDAAGLGHAQGDGTDDGYFAKLFTKAKQSEVTQSPNDSGNNDKATASPADDQNKPESKDTNPPSSETPGIKSKASKHRTPQDPGSNPASSDTGTTGLPFVKLPSRSPSPSPIPASQEGTTHGKKEVDGVDATSLRSHDRESTEEQPVYGCKAHKKIKETRDVTVGISRLHLVKMPDLQLAPIYWSPVHDTAIVTRGTWFYQDTMFPVEPPVANQLEMGYRELRPWSETWGDELKSALEVGAAAEEKVAHQLWPKKEYLNKGAHKDNVLATDSYCAASCFHGEVAAEGLLNPDHTSAGTQIAKKYPNCQVIYKDARHAFILKPSLQPSDYHGRRPMQKIMKGATVGILVVRGFDWSAWEKLHPTKKSAASVKTDEEAPVGGDLTVGKSKGICTACAAQEERKTPTDLILVIHGIGQKLSERMESFHFTHAMNALRRSVHVELAHPDVQSVMRKDLGGVMVLPVNWRSNLTFDTNEPDEAERDFSLKDITPDTIPAVRNMISDVMLDIPFYMSVHKAKIIEAVIQEANRVYRLWCKNNPGFAKEGRTHIIAHSLGSAIAMEALSRQPTVHPKLDISSKKVNFKYFDFDTTNLFFVGSPAAFFLFLDGSKLFPRRGLEKPGAQPEEYNSPAVAGEIGTLGCMAVKNIYNVMHYNDPIAYRMNATIDNQYATSLKSAQLPSTTVGFVDLIVKAISPGDASKNEPMGQPSKPAPIARLPSQMEMEEHDFNREEIAEKKSYLLNDNGQVDWYTNAGQGAFDNQYINMLGAHSSYWTSPDFIRMVVIEVGRKPGRNNALPTMKAVKTKK